MGIVYTVGMLIDGDEINIRNKEERAYFAWVRERKAQILKMSNPARRQEEWNKLFPKWVQDDSYLEGDVF